MTELVFAKGDIAVATIRKPAMISDLAAQYGPERSLVLKLDVIKANEIKSAFDAAVKAFGRVGVVFNNAGYAVVGEFEATSEQTARALFGVNFFGAANVTKEAVRVFRDVNRPQGGRLLQMSSMAVLTDAAAIAYYAARAVRDVSLWQWISTDDIMRLALKAVNDALSAELDPDRNIRMRAPMLGVV